MQTDTDQPQTSCGDHGRIDSSRRQAATHDGTITIEQYYALQSRRQVAVRLPPHGQTWETDDIEGIPTGAVNSLHRSGVVNCVERNYGSVNVWETAPGVYSWVSTHFTGRPTCPGTKQRRCLETGVRCLTAGERYSCTDPDCDATFGPETAKRLMNGERPPRPGGSQRGSGKDTDGADTQEDQN